MSITGTGRFRIGNRSFTIDTNEIGWLDTRHQAIVWPDRRGSWEFLWIRMDSELLHPISGALCVERDPIFAPCKAAATVAMFRRIFRLLHDGPPNLDAALHAAVGSLIAAMMESRRIAVASLDPSELRASRKAYRLTAVLNTMRVKYRQQWTVEALAEIAGLSTSHFFSRFHQATGSSPMNWLRRERINQAKRRLCETQDSIHDIAELVGYADPLYFSRDFKKLVGVSPRRYRQQEQTTVLRRSQPMRRGKPAGAIR